MTTASMTSATPTTHASQNSASFANTLASEWSKLVTLRSTHIMLGLGLLLSLATTALVSLALGSTQESWAADFSPITTSMVGNIFALIIYSVFGVLAMSREYTSGTIRVTLIATPSRSRVLSAKLILVGLITLVFGLVTTVGMFLIAQAILGAYGMPSTSLGDADARRMVLGLGAVMPFFPIVGLALGVLLRSTSGAITAVLGFIWLPVIFGEFMPRWAQEHVISLLPGNGLDSFTISHVEPSPAFSDPALGALIAATWLVAIVGAAYVAFVRRDA